LAHFPVVLPLQQTQFTLAFRAGAGRQGQMAAADTVAALIMFTSRPTNKSDNKSAKRKWP
jgi:hypothetical protein